MDLTFISLLRVLSKRGWSCSFELPVIACVHYASSPQAAIERGCSIGANHARNCQLSSDLKTSVAIARFRMIRARFNKRSMQAFPKTDRRSDICNAPLLNLKNRRGLLRLLGATA